jgi:serine O-acetyltransferase
MADTDWIDAKVEEMTGKLQGCSRCEVRRARGRTRRECLPGKKEVHDVLDSLIGILFPGCHGHGPFAHGTLSENVQELLKATIVSLQDQITKAMIYNCQLDDCDDCDDCETEAVAATQHLVESLPGIQVMLQDDIIAAFEGDPAAKSPVEVVLSYPAIQAIATYRIAHELYASNVPLIARIMTELAHSRTGIDIHPGADIAPGFFIDHGTGVVIGETAVIGEKVKIYQGVTLGAMSFPKGEDGKPVKGIKRHPNVGKGVTIYAEATLLGNIDIGEGSEIGGNVWLTHSVPPHSKVTNVQPDPQIRS